MPRKKISLRNRFSRKRRAFTLFEMLIVIMLIMLVGGIAVTQLGGVFDSAQQDVEATKVKDSFSVPLTLFRKDMGSYPSTEQGLNVLRVAPSDGADRWKGPYVDKDAALLDSWKNPYQYAYPGTHNQRSYDLWSKGPDGQSGTADDIGNWEK